MAMLLTQPYLETSQKNALGMRADEIKLLDASAQRAQIDIVGMKNTLDQNALEHTAFIAEMTRLRSLHA